MENAVLEIPGECGDRGDHQDDEHGQLHIQQQHSDKNAQHIGQGPEHVEQVPGRHGGDAVGIAHDPGVDISHRGHIVVGKGQRLQMDEAGPLQVPPKVHLNAHGAAGK